MSMINSIIAYSFNKLASHLDDDEQVKNEASSKILTIMTSLLDHEVSRNSENFHIFLIFYF